MKTSITMCHCCGLIFDTQRLLEEHYIEDSKYHRDAELMAVGELTPYMIEIKQKMIERLRKKHIEEDAMNIIGK